MCRLRAKAREFPPGTPWDLNPGFLLPRLEAPLWWVEIIQFPACHVAGAGAGAQLCGCLRNSKLVIWSFLEKPLPALRGSGWLRVGAVKMVSATWQGWELCSSMGMLVASAGF